MLEAMEIEDIKDILPEPTAPPEPQKIDDQSQENMYFLMPTQDRPLFDVFPDQDHAQHIKAIDDLLNGPMAEELKKEEYQDVVPAILDHRKKHLAFLYMNNQIRLQQYEQRRLQNMATESNYAGSPEEIATALQSQGQGYDMQGGGIEEATGSMAGSGALTPNRYGNETGFLDQVLPIQHEE